MVTNNDLLWLNQMDVFTSKPWSHVPIMFALLTSSFLEMLPSFEFWDTTFLKKIMILTAFLSLQKSVDNFITLMT